MRKYYTKRIKLILDSNFNYTKNNKSFILDKLNNLVDETLYLSICWRVLKTINDKIKESDDIELAELYMFLKHHSSRLYIDLIINDLQEEINKITFVKEQLEEMRFDIWLLNITDVD